MIHDEHSLAHTHPHTHTNSHNCHRDHIEQYFCVSCIPLTGELEKESLKQKLKPLFFKEGLLPWSLKIAHENGWLTD